MQNPQIIGALIKLSKLT